MQAAGSVWNRWQFNILCAQWSHYANSGPNGYRIMSLCIFEDFTGLEQWVYPRRIVWEIIMLQNCYIIMFKKSNLVVGSE